VVGFNAKPRMQLTGRHGFRYRRRTVCERRHEESAGPECRRRVHRFDSLRADTAPARRSRLWPARTINERPFGVMPLPHRIPMRSRTVMFATRVARTGGRAGGTHARVAGRHRGGRGEFSEVELPGGQVPGGVFVWVKGR